MPDFNGLINITFKINLALFFINGHFYDIWKRLMNIKYVFSKSPS